MVFLPGVCSPPARPGRGDIVRPWPITYGRKEYPLVFINLVIILINY
jgi:hypothetical protein